MLWRTTMVGAVFHHVSRGDPDRFQAMKGDFGRMSRLEPPADNKRKRHEGLRGAGDGGSPIAMSQSEVCNPSFV